jgi:hypothetical protein
MKTNPALVVLSALLLAVLAGAGLTQLHAAPSTTNAAEYCTYVGPSYLGNKEVTPSGEYCVPGP